MNLKLEFPSEKHEKMYNILIKEWRDKENIENTAPWALFRWENFNDFLQQINQLTINPPNWYTKSTLFFLILENKILWAIDVRHNINSPSLKEEWWHIWYWIAPKFRKKWYATKMLGLWLIEAKNIWLEKVFITCDIDNIWSNKVILSNWGIFERLTKDWTKNRYWVNT